MAKYIFTLIAVCFLIQCKNTSAPTPQLQPIEIQKVVDKMTEIMVHDITNPPLAARFFSYACLAGYEVAAEHETTLRPMQDVLNEYPTIEKPNIKEAYAPTLAAVVAMMETAKKLQPSGHLMEEFEKKYLDSCQNIGFSKPVIENSIQYAKAISEQILKYAKADKYNRISNYPRYTPSVGDGFWYPTPPGYMAAVEPYFNTVRPFSLDSAAQFKPEPPAVFSTDKKSVFYQLMNAVYSQNMSDEHKAIASFWDCNPFALDDNGHLMVALKKISPGAHWMGITGIACQKTKADFSKNIQVHTLVAMGLMDGFICCWDEKYRSNRVRPETVIRKFIDPNWKPFLQTPPFPEYLSGHSTISSTSATILTHFFGDNFAYDDTVEERYGLKARPFSSFKKAASEAGISRFYGGIHYMDAIENGQKQGELVGNNVLKRYLNKN